MSVVVNNSHLPITVVINNHNNAAFLHECIKSVLNQHDPPEEIVIVDDGSTDESKLIIHEFASLDSRIRPFFDEQTGQIGAVGRGVERARNELVLLLDSDDVYAADHVHMMRRRCREFPHADLVYCRTSLIGEKNLVSRLQTRLKGDDFRVLLGPLENTDRPYDWGYLAAFSSLEPANYIGNVTSALALRKKHVNTSSMISFANVHKHACRDGADQFLLLQSALLRGRRVYAPDRSVGYRIRSNSAFAATLLRQDPTAVYKFGMRTVLVQKWLLREFALSPIQAINLLYEELMSAPEPSQAHLQLYKRVRKSAYNQEFSLVQRLRMAISNRAELTRFLLYRHGVDTYGKGYSIEGGVDSNP